MFPPSPASHEPDEELLHAIGQGSQPAFMALYARYGAAVYGLVLRVLAQPAAAEEVTQDVLLKIWQQPTRWNPALGRFPSWLMTTARNAAIDRLRRDQRHRADPIPSEDEAADSHAAHAAPSPVDDPLWAAGQDLRALLAALPTEQRRLLELAYYKGYTHSELAQLLSLPLGTVKTRLRAAIIQLRALWDERERRAGAHAQSARPSANV